MTLRSARFKHSALLAGGFFATAFTSLFVGGCSFFYDLNTTQCEVDSDCTAFGPQFSNTQCINRVCVAKQSGFGAVRAGYIELSNVDLSKEFSELIIMQRGYQASSQIVSTANEMIQQLFSMRGK